MKDYTNFINNVGEERKNRKQAKIDRQIAEIKECMDYLLERKDLLNTMINNAQALNRNNISLSKHTNGIENWQHGYFYQPFNTEHIGFGNICEGKSGQVGIWNIDNEVKYRSREQQVVYCDNEIKLLWTCNFLRNFNIKWLHR